jgi:hypothetical protein
VSAVLTCECGPSSRRSTSDIRGSRSCAEGARPGIQDQVEVTCFGQRHLAVRASWPSARPDCCNHEPAAAWSGAGGADRTAASGWRESEAAATGSWPLGRRCNSLLQSNTGTSDSQTPLVLGPSFLGHVAEGPIHDFRPAGEEHASTVAQPQVVARQMTACQVDGCTPGGDHLAAFIEDLERI